MSSQGCQEARQEESNAERNQHDPLTRQLCSHGAVNARASSSAGRLRFCPAVFRGDSGRLLSLLTWLFLNFICRCLSEVSWMIRLIDLLGSYR